MNLTWMTLCQWYRELIKSVTHKPDENGGPTQLIPTRVEDLYDDIDWNRSNRLASHPRLSPEQSSFLFLLKNDLLVTRERLHRLKKAPDPFCAFCHQPSG